MTTQMLLNSKCLDMLVLCNECGQSVVMFLLIFACNVPSELKRVVERSEMIILSVSGLSSRTWWLPSSSRGRRIPPTCRGSWISSRWWLPPTPWGCRGLPPTSRGSWRLPPSFWGSRRLPSASRGRLPPSCWICWYVCLSVFV